MSNKGWGWVKEGFRRGAVAADQRRPECGVQGCAAMYRENDRGGEARGVVLEAALMLGIELGRNIQGSDGIWSPENMRRILDGIRGLQYEVARSKGMLGYPTFYSDVQVGPVDRV